MANRYCCPNCRSNRMTFDLFYRLVRRVRKDPHRGDIIDDPGAPQIVRRPDGEPELEVQCPYCWFRGPETMFVAGARRYPPPELPTGQPYGRAAAPTASAPSLRGPPAAGAYLPPGGTPGFGTMPQPHPPAVGTRPPGG